MSSKQNTNSTTTFESFLRSWNKIEKRHSQTDITVTPHFQNNNPGVKIKLKNGFEATVIKNTAAGTFNFHSLDADAEQTVVSKECETFGEALKEVESFFFVSHN